MVMALLTMALLNSERTEFSFPNITTDTRHKLLRNLDMWLKTPLLCSLTTWRTETKCLAYNKLYVETICFHHNLS